MNSPYFSEKQVIDLFEVTRQRLYYWRKIGLLRKPDPSAPKGYSYQDLLSIKIITNLLKSRIQVSKIKRALDNLKKIEPDLQNPLIEKTFYVSGNSVVIKHNEQHMDVLSQQYLLFDLRDLDEELKADPIVRKAFYKNEQLKRASNG